MFDLKVEGMTCEGCARAVTKAVQRADPEARVAVDVHGGRVSVELSASREKLAEAIEAAGYDVAA